MVSNTPAINNTLLELHVPDFANVVEPLVLQPWGLKDFRVADPFGYYLRFCPKHDILNVENAVE